MFAAFIDTGVVSMVASQRQIKSREPLGFRSRIEYRTDAVTRRARRSLQGRMAPQAECHGGEQVRTEPSKIAVSMITDMNERCNSSFLARREILDPKGHLH